jgi:phosphoribosyl 1,2-cyclic phosphate phosphodiesterase
MSGSGKLKITLMGTGTSHGIPMIACKCPVCTSSDPHDQRYRCCVKVEFGNSIIVIDTPPEFRLQCLAHDVPKIDAVLFTHTHADHVFGLDDTRRFSAIHHCEIVCYGSARTVASLKRIFPYAFDNEEPEVSERPKLSAVAVSEPFDLFGQTIIPLELYHGRQSILGYRIDDFAYCTDCSDIPEATYEKLKGVDTLILDALRYTPHPTHFNVDQALVAAKRIGARQTYFTHIAHEIRHADLESKLPKNISLGYDGLSFEL